MHAFALYVTSNIAQNVQRFRVITKIYANFFKNDLSIIFNNFCTFIAQNIYGIKLPNDKRGDGCGVI